MSTFRVWYKERDNQSQLSETIYRQITKRFSAKQPNCLVCFISNSTGSSLSLKEDEENRQHKATEGGQMVPVQGLALEKNGNNQSEDYQ